MQQAATSARQRPAKHFKLAHVWNAYKKSADGVTSDPGARSLGCSAQPNDGPFVGAAVFRLRVAGRC